MSDHQAPKYQPRGLMFRHDKKSVKKIA